MGCLQGRLPDGQDIAVKRLTWSTKQGLNQLHNEVQVLAELQHKKLVRLLGFCSHRDERMLVYEHVKNGSLDKVLFGTFLPKLLSISGKVLIRHTFIKVIATKLEFEKQTCHEICES
jgi:serine/threonine protein kinase